MTSPGRILVLDEDLGMCRTIGDVLEHRGHAVQIATQARVGLDLLTTSPADVAIVDIRLPDISGTDVLSAIRRTDRAIVEYGVLEPDSRFMQKPFTPAGLGTKVRDVLDG